MKQPTPPSPHGSRPGASLAAYLSGAVGSSLLLVAPQAEAAVTSITFGFGSVLDAADALNGSNVSTTPDFGTIIATANQIPADIHNPIRTTLRMGDIVPGYGFVYQQGPGYYGGGPGGSQLGFGLASFLADGAVVGTGNNGVLGMAYFASPRSDRSFATDQLNQNIGFMTTTGNWGWPM